jgi:hypothetical protein
LLDAEPVRFLALVVLFLSGCPSGYSSRAIVAEHDVDARSFASFGCLEVAFGLLPRAHPEDVALVVARFGNNCLQPTPFNLAALRVTGVTHQGSLVSLSLIDPRNEIQPLHLDAGGHGVEKVRVGGPLDLAAVCVDARGLAPPGPEPATPFCFRPNPDYFAGGS